MKLYQLLQSYDFDEIIPVINEMFPGTSKFRKQLKQAYDLMLAMSPVASKQTIRYKQMKAPDGNLSYIGAEDSNFTSTWEVSLGKDVSREHGVDLSDVELLANCFVNLCLLGQYPQAFDSAHKIITK